MIQIMAAVEGASDEGAAMSILAEFGISVSMFHGGGGRSSVLKKLSAYNASAKFTPWFVLVDLDSEPCVAESVREWLPNPSEMMIFRVAVTELEAWLLADREAVAAFLGVSESKIPRNPDDLEDPKREIINLARRSRKRDIREGLVPRPNSGASVGPTYVSDIRNFGQSLWRPRIAAGESPSLARCMKRLEEFVARIDALED